MSRPVRGNSAFAGLTRAGELVNITLVLPSGGSSELVLAQAGDDGGWARVPLPQPVAESRIDLGSIVLGKLPLLCART